MKNRAIFVKKRKFHSYGWMDVVIITKVAQSVQHLLPHMREDATPLVSCIVNDAVVQPMPSMQQNAAITFYAF